MAREAEATEAATEVVEMAAAMGAVAKGVETGEGASVAAKEVEVKGVVERVEAKVVEAAVEGKEVAAKAAGLEEVRVAVATEAERAEGVLAVARVAARAAARAVGMVVDWEGVATAVVARVAAATEAVKVEGAMEEVRGGEVTAVGLVAVERVAVTEGVAMAVGLEVAMVEAKAAAVMEVALGLVAKVEAEGEGVGKVEVAMEAAARAEAGCTRRLEQVATGVAVMEEAASVGVTGVEAMAVAPAVVKAVEA